MNFRLSRLRVGAATFLIEKALRAPIELEAEQAGLTISLLSPCCEAQIHQRQNGIQPGQNASCVSCGEPVHLTCSFTREWDYLAYNRAATIQWLEEVSESLYAMDPLTAVLDASEYIVVIQEFNDLILRSARNKRMNRRTTAQDARLMAQTVLSRSLMPAQ